MSYINDALRKAQKDKDNRYEPFGEIIVPGPEGPSRLRKRRAVLGTTAALGILGCAALFFAVYGLQQPAARTKGAPPPSATVAEMPAPKATEGAIRPPDAYKGKGIRYQGEVVRLKPGKAAKAVGAKA